MEWSDVVRKRRMVRDFEDRPVDREVLQTILDAARRVPSAGFTQGIEFLVLEGPDTALFWDQTLPNDERAAFRWPGLLRAPVIVLPIADGPAYVARYAEPDKARAGLGTGEDAWPIPYWFVDTGMAAMVLLQGVVEHGLGALFFGIFRNEAELMRSLGVPEGKRPIGAIALGHPTEAAKAAAKEGSPSRRPRRPLDEVVHFGSW